VGFDSQLIIFSPSKDGILVKFFKMKILRVKVGKKLNFQEGITLCGNIGFSSYSGIWQSDTYSYTSKRWNYGKIF